MLQKLTSGYTIKATSPLSIDFTGAPAVTATTLLGIVDVTLGAEIFVADDPALGGQWQGRVLVLDLPAGAVANSDQLFVFVNDGRTAAGDDTLGAFATTQHADEVAALAVLDVLATENTLRGVADDVNNFATQAHTDATKIDTDLNGGFGTNHQDLQAILTVLQAQRQETLWTDDTRAYFVRLDNRGTITWTDVSGNASAAPGAGARPAAGDDALLDKSSYQAINASASYAVGDLIDHVITTDPKSGAIVGHYWINLTAEAPIAAPPAADLEPLSRLPDDAARASLQTSIGATAHADAGKIDADLVAFAGQAHTDAGTIAADVVQLDTDLKAAATQAHTDSGKLDTDLNTFAAATHTDLTKISGQLPASLGAKPSAQSVAVTLAPDGQFAASVGLPGDAPAADDTSAASVVSLLRRGLARWTTFLSRFPAALGQAVSAASLPVVIASDQSVIPVAGTAAIGTPPANPPLSVSGVDPSGLKRHLLTDTAGQLATLPFAPVRGTTVRLTVGPSATTNPVAFPKVAGVTSYRVRNEATSASPVTWALASSAPAAAPVIPTPYDVTGANGVPGDKTIDPGGVEIIALTAAQTAAAAAGTLLLTAICPANGSAILSVTLGTGA